jgi:hypothetical protein
MKSYQPSGAMSALTIALPISIGLWSALGLVIAIVA